MGARGVHIERILVRDLYDFACETIEQSSDQDIIPITPQRALAQTKNPYADGEDVGLLAAYSNGEIIGYQGLLPGRLRWQDGLAKVYWASAGYVAPEYRKKLVALALIQEVLALSCDFVNTGLSEAAKRHCEGWRFQPIGPLEYYTLNLSRLKKWNPLSLPARLLRRAMMKIAGAHSGIVERTIRASDRLSLPFLKSLFYRLALCSQTKLLRRVGWEEVCDFGDEETRLIANRQAGPVFYRGVECINWMLRHKWIVEPTAAKSRRFRYEFSHVHDVFRYMPLKVYSSDGGDYLGFLTLSISTQKGTTCLKVLDFGCRDPSGHEYVASIALRFAADHLADQIIMPCQLADPFRKTFPAKLLCSRQTRSYYCHPYDAQSPLASALSEIELNYCDGDCAFT